MQPRRIARELALLSISQMPNSPERLDTQQLNNLVLAAIRTLTGEIQEALETAAAELKRGSDRILESETRATDVRSARAMVTDAIELTEKAINHLGSAVEIPEIVQLSNTVEVRSYTLEILKAVSRRQLEIDQMLNQALKDWQLKRLPRIDRDILRMAVAEISFLGIPDRVAINEAVELAKRYSDEEGHRFINGVLRRANELIKTQALTQ
ncbi:MAG: transcription antitermination protein NusB [Moorea sp. SIO1F2]|uniref:transcription antitermination factor NusB n=1 Tax=unclassified Moorena TaxID=2683338 RepID=UPI0013B72E82|nr:MULTISPECIES: transcription antitermination factor NusB [unclassified Moorena]NEO09850.1 transcription antitermination protein NusB [Moorena sp. SIO3I8]NEO20654.1 transcription antitermination protein NusB [Moorena sp. SIO4A5]NEP23696.1 transcription antitermination protein NusB [Moorena sp. SIO3I6]NEQ59090.1 transcription antitermination protein NusB [Moorena sp. SIO4A1]NET85312.1 transcription antitermination protein NusB [Moorena sp. SIO1F2]